MNLWKTPWRRIALSLIAAIAALSVVTTTAVAFDGKHRGFTIGLGLNAAPLLHNSTPRWVYWSQTINDTVYVYGSPQTERIDKTGFGLDVTVGYFWNEADCILYREAYTFYQTDPTLSQGMSALCWSHYFGRSRRQFFSLLGIGYYRLNDWSSLGGSRTDPGLGMLAGIGWEFARHWEGSLVLHHGNISHHVPTKCTLLAVSLTARAY